MLHGLIDRRDQTVSIGRVVVFFICIEHLRAVVALRRDDLTGRALQIRIVVRLEALGADIIRRHEAHHLRRERRIGIIALRVGLEVHALDLVLRDKIAHLVGKLLRDLPADDLVAERLVRGLLVNKIGAHV